MLYISETTIVVIMGIPNQVLLFIFTTFFFSLMVSLSLPSWISYFLQIIFSVGYVEALVLTHVL